MGYKGRQSKTTTNPKSRSKRQEPIGKNNVKTNCGIRKRSKNEEMNKGRMYLRKALKFGVDCGFLTPSKSSRNLVYISPYLLNNNKVTKEDETDNKSCSEVNSQHSVQRNKDPNHQGGEDVESKRRRRRSGRSRSRSRSRKGRKRKRSRRSHHARSISRNRSDMNEVDEDYNPEKKITRNDKEDAPTVSNLPDEHKDEHKEEYRDDAPMYIEEDDSEDEDKKKSENDQ